MYQHEGQHECMTCGKRFHEKYQLSNHAKSHAGPFACTQCPRTFEKRSSLRSHLSSHDGFRRLLDCPFTGCGKQYRRGGCLNRHIKSVSQVYGQNPCDSDPKRHPNLRW
jgi:KRAB domain-containing zinc finger protein